MGKSPKPLKILIHPQTAVCFPEDLDKLIDQGHTIHVLKVDCSDITIRQDNDGTITHIKDYDLILGPNCWRAFDLRHLDLAIKSARNVKYGTAKAKVAKKPHTPRKKKGDEGLEQS